MIKFKNVAGDSFLAVGTIQRKFALNGEKSLSGVLYDGDDVLNNIDKGWSLDFGGEPYIVSYFERNDSDNTLSFDAVHKFFWVMSKSVMYSQTSGSHTIQWYLDQIFANTGYTYALNFSPNAIAKDNWGMKTKLSLFNDIISSINGEFEINGTLISVFEKVGSDLSTIVRYGFNLSDMSIENDAAGFVTYGEGFGAYEDQQNQSGPRLHATYTSPLASVYGILQSEPVDDQRYTIESSIIGAIKAKVDASFSVSIKLSLYDLTAAGYPYKMAHVGDWLMAIDEKLDFKQRIRIISIDDEFDANGNRISYTVTAGNIGVVQKYQEANASLSSQVNNALDTANKASDDANIALISANGKNTSYYVDSVDALPTTANEGDMGWVQSGDGRVLYIYTKKPDGTYYWEKRIDPEMSEQIAAGVDKAVTDAKTYSDQAIATNRAQVDAEIKTVSDKTAQLESEQAELGTKAQGYANQALADAQADTRATAAQTAKDASDALAAAKTDLTTSLNKEATDRANAVTALDTKAQGYATQAKTDAISAATTADGVINKKIDDTASSITTTISQNKADADGKITTAQTTAQQALDGLSTKVSQTAYDTKTGQLQTDLTAVTTTANGNKTDIVAIKATNDSQDARMTTIESDANGVKTTVSDLQTNQGKQAGSISSLEQRADGFDATVTKVNNLQVGGRNYVLDTGNPKTQQGNGQDSQDLYNSAVFSSPIKNWGVADADYTISFDWELTTPLTDPMQLGVFFNQSPWEPIYNTVPSGQKNGHISYTFKLLAGILTATPEITGLNFRVNSQLATGNSIAYSHLTFEQGNLPKDWTPAPEDLESATAKAQFTADQAALSISNYKTDADGRISRAQSDINQNAHDITTKVSQTDYDQKTGDLESKVSTAQQTADGAVTTIGDYKRDNDGRISAAESKIDQNAHDITTKVSQTDYDQKTGELAGKISSVSQTAGEIKQSVSDVQTQVNALNQVNLINNSDFRPDLSGWAVQNPQAGTVTTGEYDYAGNVMVLNNTAGGILRVSSVPIAITSVTSVSYDLNYYIFNLGDGGVVTSQLSYLDSNMNEIDGSYPGYINLSTFSVGSWQKRTVQNLELTPPSGAVYIGFVFDVQGAGTRAGINRPILVRSNTVGDYVAGQYVNNDKISVVSQKVDSITSIVSDPTTGLSTRVQTAEGTLSQVTGADIPALKNATYWQPYGSLDFNTYTKQGSFFFNTTADKTNGPTSSTSWIYLKVDQGTSDNGRIKQTAWYDGVTGVKITYVRTLNSGTWSPWYANDNDSVTTISQTNEAIRTETSNRQTGDDNTLTQAKDFTTSSISNSESGMKSLVTQTSDAILANLGSSNLFPNSEFEKDYGFGDKSGNVTLSLSQKNDIGGHLNGTVTVISNASGYQGYRARNIPVYGGQSYSASVLVHYTNGGLSNGVAALDIWFVDKDGNRISTGDGGTRDNTTGQVSSPWWVKLYAEGITAPTNAAYVQVSLIVNDAGAGQNAVFTQPMVTATEKLQPYAVNNDITTQLALLKDNWSIGISDNTGVLASGVFGDINGMTLNGNTVTINANQTVITGTAFITDAMLTTMSASKLTAGTIDANQINVINLDVSHLTGDFSTFMKTQWDGLYGSVYITPDDMIITRGPSATLFRKGEITFYENTLYADGGNSTETVGSIRTGIDSSNSTSNSLMLVLNDQTFNNIGSPTGEIWGGDKIGFGIMNSFSSYQDLFTWMNPTAAAQSAMAGFNFYNGRINFNGNGIAITDAENDLLFNWVSWSGFFNGQKNPTIRASHGSWTGAGLAFGYDNLIAFNDSASKILI